MKAPHCVEDAWKLPFSTCKYLVDTVCDLNLLNNATFDPDAMHTEKFNLVSFVLLKCKLENPMLTFNRKIRFYILYFI